MNPTRRSDDEAREQEWQAQEDALRRERGEAISVDDDAALARYRLLARVLRQAPADPLPADFAAQVVRRAEQQQQRLRALQTPWERRWLTLAVLLLVSAAMAVGVDQGTDWWQTLRRLWPSLDAFANQWVLALAVLIGVNRWLGGLRGSLLPPSRLL